MIKIENLETWGFQHAVRGMRNPMNSWDKSDSNIYVDRYGKSKMLIGQKDIELIKKLARLGTEHRKFLRQIFVSMDITAPLYWWKEMDQYRINVTTNSCSTMHKIHSKEIIVEDFSIDNLTEDSVKDVLLPLIDYLNVCREKYIETKEKAFWWQIIQLLPSSFNQKRTVTMNYENVLNIVSQRKNHKLNEWVEFVKYLEMELPYYFAIKQD